MSNVAGKSYAMNVVTPLKWHTAWLNKIIFWFAQLPFFRGALDGLLTLSLIHYARWAIVKPSQFPRLHPDQPAETIKHTYMFFFSNFNGSWTQYVDSFHMAIPTGLDPGLSKSPGPVGSGEAERWVRRGCVAVAEGSPVGPGRWGGVERVCSGVWVGAWALSRRGAHGDAAARPGGAPSGVRGVPGQGGAGVRMASSASCGRAA